jgi:hypothetical protein
MMSTATLDYLLEHDGEPSWEWPAGFNHAAELCKVRGLGAELSAIAGHCLRLDDKVRDATFFAEWAAYDPVPRSWPGVSAPVRLCVIGIRFSAHGRMFTVWGNAPDHPLNDATVSALNHFLAPLGYVHVPETLLYQPHPTRGPSQTWCNRYFAYW